MMLNRARKEFLTQMWIIKLKLDMMQTTRLLSKLGMMNTVLLG
jgi:hypothetical protein